MSAFSRLSAAEWMACDVWRWTERERGTHLGGQEPVVTQHGHQAIHEWPHVDAEEINDACNIAQDGRALRSVASTDHCKEGGNELSL